MLLKDASLGDSGNYTLTAVNECGQSSLKVDVKVLTGKLIDHYRFVFSILLVGHWREHTKHSRPNKMGQYKVEKKSNSKGHILTHWPPRY